MVIDQSRAMFATSPSKRTGDMFEAVAMHVRYTMGARLTLSPVRYLLPVAGARSEGNTLECDGSTTSVSPDRFRAIYDVLRLAKQVPA